MKYYPQAIKQSREEYPCSYFNNLEEGTDIKAIEKDFSLPIAYNTLMGNSFYADRIFEYNVPRGIIRVGLKNTDDNVFLFNGDYEVKFKMDSCSKWTKRPAPSE